MQPLLRSYISLPGKFVELVARKLIVENVSMRGGESKENVRTSNRCIVSGG